MTDHGFTTERFLNETWARLEQRFTDYWSKGLVWMVAAGVCFAASALLPSGDWRLTLRVALASVVLGVGLGFLRLIGFTSVALSQPQAFLTMMTGAPSPPKSKGKAYSFYSSFMEGCFVLLEALVLFILIGSSTAVAGSPASATPDFSYGWLVPLVYGFFAGAFATKGMLTALGWSFWLRNKAERYARWQGSQWLLSTRNWTMTSLRLLRSVSGDGIKPLSAKMATASFLAVLLLIIVGAFLTLFVLAVES
ncbi:MAG: hypothetical protein NZ959_00650 [Armatimonadetes bacterium]|nr:hypothetical protein [Armatimonadota bacterium]MDW8121102.1 hypothetical protein [Armatimonadota bacterium]